MTELTAARLRILVEARDRGSVEAYGPRRRSCERLRDAGLLERIGLQTMVITPAGRASVPREKYPETELDDTG